MVVVIGSCVLSVAAEGGRVSASCRISESTARNSSWP